MRYTHRDEEAIRNIIRSRDAALCNKDVGNFVASTHPDFVNVDKLGGVTIRSGEERKRHVSRLLAQVATVTHSTDIKAIAFSESGATVESNGEMVTTFAAHGKTVEVKVAGTYQDAWVKSANRWLQKSSRAVAENITIDGQIIP